MKLFKIKNVDVILTVVTLLGTICLTMGGILFTLNDHSSELNSLETSVVQLRSQMFTRDQALRDFKFVKDDENSLYSRLDDQISTILQLVTLLNVLEGKLNSLQIQVALLNKKGECHD